MLKCLFFVLFCMLLLKCSVLPVGVRFESSTDSVCYSSHLKISSPAPPSPAPCESKMAIVKQSAFVDLKQEDKDAVLAKVEASLA